MSYDNKNNNDKNNDFNKKQKHNKQQSRSLTSLVFLSFYPCRL